MAEINKLTGQDYKLFNYYGASDAEKVIITMESSAGCIRTVKIITVGDRTKEPGAAGEPLYEDVASVISESGKNISVLTCRFGLGSRTNTILQAAFFKITGIIPIDKAVGYMKVAILKTYDKKGEKVVNMNYAAVDNGVGLVKEVEVPTRWAEIKPVPETVDSSLPEWIRKIQIPVNSMTGDNIPVSAFIDLPDGTM